MMKITNPTYAAIRPGETHFYSISKDSYAEYNLTGNEKWVLPDFNVPIQDDLLDMFLEQCDIARGTIDKNINMLQKSESRSGDILVLETFEVNGIKIKIDRDYNCHLNYPVDELEKILKIFY
jgi:hypothetical protein